MTLSKKLADRIILISAVGGACYLFGLHGAAPIALSIISLLVLIAQASSRPT